MNQTNQLWSESQHKLWFELHEWLQKYFFIINFSHMDFKKVIFDFFSDYCIL